MLGFFPKTYKSNRHIIVAVDYLTKWTEVRAIPKGEANEVANFIIEQILLRHGPPKQIVFDRGAAFVSNISDSVTRKNEHSPQDDFSIPPAG